MKLELNNSITTKISSEKEISFYEVTPKKALVIARLFARLLRASDTILLFGEIGSGKSFFARGVIQSMMINQSIMVEEVPSPTFTIVQTYDALFPSVWHVDLYRVSVFDEIFELDLEDGIETGICLIEWPNKLGRLIPKRNISIKFDLTEPDHNMRKIQIEFNGEGWKHISDAFIKSFLK